MSIGQPCTTREYEVVGLRAASRPGVGTEGSGRQPHNRGVLGTVLEDATTALSQFAKTQAVYQPGE